MGEFEDLLQDINPQSRVTSPYSDEQKSRILDCLESLPRERTLEENWKTSAMKKISVIAIEYQLNKCFEENKGSINRLKKLLRKMDSVNISYNEEIKNLDNNIVSAIYLSSIKSIDPDFDVTSAGSRVQGEKNWDSVSLSFGVLLTHAARSKPFIDHLLFARFGAPEKTAQRQLIHTLADFVEDLTDNEVTAGYDRTNEYNTPFNKLVKAVLCPIESNINENQVGNIVRHSLSKR